MKRKSQESLNDHSKKVIRLRTEAGLSSKDASALCALSKNLWASVERAERPLPKPAFELFCLKTGLDFSIWSEKKMYLPSDEQKSLVEFDANVDVTRYSTSEKFGRLRLHLKLNFEEVSKFAGLSRDKWKKMESGEVHVSAPAVELLCLKFGINSAPWAVKKVYIFDRVNRCIVPVI